MSMGTLRRRSTIYLQTLRRISEPQPDRRREEGLVPEIADRLTIADTSTLKIILAMKRSVS
jgi:hypothetical protein